MTSFSAQDAKITFRNEKNFLEIDLNFCLCFQFMAKTGNLKSNAVYEKNVPACWRRPTPFDHHLEFYVEEWIRAKYERKEFMEGNESKQTYCQG